MEKRVKRIALLFFLTVICYAAVSILYVFQLPNLDAIELHIGILTKIAEAVLFVIGLFLYLTGSVRARLILLGFLVFIILSLAGILVTPFIHKNGNLLLAFFNVIAISFSCIATYELIKSLDVERIESQFSERTPIKIVIGFFLIAVLILSFGIYGYYEKYIRISGPAILDPRRYFLMDNILRVLFIFSLLLIIYLLLFKKTWRYVITSAVLVSSSVPFVSSFSGLLLTDFAYPYIIDSLLNFLWVCLAFAFLRGLSEDSEPSKGKGGQVSV